MEKTTEQKIVQNDIMRYKTNKVASSLALLALVFDCLYFCLLYSYRDLYFNTWRLGVSVVLTLFTLLFTFLASEGIKGYKKNYAILLLVLAAIQIIRIFGIPLEALTHDVQNGTQALNMRYFGADLTPTASFIILTVWLCASAACLIASAVIGYLNSVKLETFNAKIESGEIVIDKVLKDIEVKEESAASAETKAEVE